MNSTLNLKLHKHTIPPESMQKTAIFSINVACLRHQVVGKTYAFLTNLFNENILRQFLHLSVFLFVAVLGSRLKAG
jgi:hypothetical protein